VTRSSIEPAAARHAAPSAQRELLLAGLHFEEEDIAPRFVGSRPARDVARPHVVRNEIAGLDVEIFEKQRVAAVDHRALARDVERHDLLGAAAHRVDEIEAIDAVVVFCLRFDVHFFEPRHRSVGRRFQHTDFRRTILERADEVLGVAGVGHPVAVRQRDPIRVVVHDFQRSGPRGRRVGGQRNRLAVDERQLSGRRGTVGSRGRDIGAGRREICRCRFRFAPRGGGRRDGLTSPGRPRGADARRNLRWVM
jgi:hypothetical protein